MFLEENDYRVVCCEADLDVITQSSDDIRQQAERIAMDEIAGYVRARYDIEAAYAAEGAERCPLLVQMTVSVALYYLGMWLLQFMASEVRETLYENAINRLKDIQRGAFTPDLPAYPPDDKGNDTTNPMRYGSMAAQRYDY